MSPFAGPTTPLTIHSKRFGLLRFRSPLLTESLRFLLLQVLRCFNSLSSPPFRDVVAFPTTGSPIRTSPDLRHLRLPEAFRSFSRPSSLTGAKSSTFSPSPLTFSPHSYNLSPPKKIYTTSLPPPYLLYLPSYFSISFPSSFHSPLPPLLHHLSMEMRGFEPLTSCLQGRRSPI